MNYEKGRELEAMNKGIIEIIIYSLAERRKTRIMIGQESMHFNINKIKNTWHWREEYQINNQNIIIILTKLKAIIPPKQAQRSLFIKVSPRIPTAALNWDDIWWPKL